MREQESIREREPETRDAQYNDIMNRWATRKEGMKNGKVVIKAKDLLWEISPQARFKMYLSHRNWDDAALRDWLVFIHDVHTNAEGITTSGKHRHQGGLGLFAIEGEGYTVVDEVRYDWKAGDFIMLPIKPDGCVHQHFARRPDSSCKWIAFIWEPLMVATGSDLTQIKKSQVFSPET